MKILIMTDSPFIPTGQARVGREIAVGLSNRGFEIGYIGWWHQSSIIPNLPNNIQFWWTNNKLYGEDVFDQVVNYFRPDIVLTIGDFWFLEYISDMNRCRTRRLFQWCSYIPVDGEPLNGGLPPAIIKTIEDIDIPVAYTNYAKDAVLKSVMNEETRNRIRTIYHGIDLKQFKQLEPSLRRKEKEKYGIHDKFMFLNVSRNQSRKNIPELMKAWKIFSELPETKGKVILWPHMNFKDSMGWDIDDMIKAFKLNNQSIMYYKQIAYGANEFQMLKDDELAMLYQISDAFILLSNEGFGLPTFEAMATRVPCILLNHSASAEIGAQGRSHLVDISGSATWVGRFLTEKPVPDVDLTVEGMLKIFRDKKYRDAVATTGFEFVKQYTWDSIVDEWSMLFTEIEIPFIKPMRMEVVV